MIFVDSGVWIDFFNGVASPPVQHLMEVVSRETVLLGDVVLTEVLQGFRSDRAFEEAGVELRRFPLVNVVDGAVALQAARNYRLLRARGVTVRKTIDALIATRCIAEGWSLLHRDRDYQPFITHLGLRPAIRAS